MCDNMLLSSEKVGIKKEQFIIVAFDKPIYEYYFEKGYNVELFKDGPEEAYHEWTWDQNSKFRDLVKNKWQIIGKYFKTNKPLMWLDTDVVFVKNPENNIKSLSTPTFQIDYPVFCACTGLMYFPDCQLSEELINVLAKQNTEDDQIVCNNLLKQNAIQNRVGFFNLDYFPNGSYFYDAKKTNIEQTIMLHCNYIVGIENKINRLKDAGVWYL